MSTTADQTEWFRCPGAARVLCLPISPCLSPQATGSHSSFHRLRRLAFSGMACSWNHAAHFFSCRIRFHGVDGPQLAHSVTRRTSVGEHAHAGFHADMRLRLLWANSTEHGCRAPCRMFRFVRNRHTVSQRCRAALRARQRRARLPGSPHPRQRLASLVFRLPPC